MVHLPEEGVVFTGDILFHGGHPIVWAGPVSNWIKACERVLELGPAIIVPGHGPLAEPSALGALRSYFEWLSRETRSRYDSGMPLFQAALDIAKDGYAGWTEPERLAVNVAALYRDFGSGETEEPLGLMARLASALGA